MMQQRGRNAKAPYMAPRRHFRWRHPQNGAHSITLSFFSRLASKSSTRQIVGWGNVAAMLQRCTWRRGAISGGARSITVIFQPICFKFGYKVDRRMGNDIAALPHCLSHLISGKVLSALISQSTPLSLLVLLFLYCSFLLYLNHDNTILIYLF